MEPSTSGLELLGEVVIYTLSAHDVVTATAQRTEHGMRPDQFNGAPEGQELPAVVVKVWTPEVVDLKVWLDGEDALWVNERTLGEGVHHWRYRRPA